MHTRTMNLFYREEAQRKRLAELQRTAATLDT